MVIFVITSHSFLPEIKVSSSVLDWRNKIFGRKYLIVLFEELDTNYYTFDYEMCAVC